MAARKRQHRRPRSSRRKWRSIRPLLEYLENRLVLSQGSLPTLSPNLLTQLGSMANYAGFIANGMLPVPLAHGGISWLQVSGSAAQGTPRIEGQPHGLPNPPSKSQPVLRAQAPFWVNSPSVHPWWLADPISR